MDTKSLPTRFHRKKAESFSKRIDQAKQQISRLKIFGTVASGSIEKDSNERITQEDIVHAVDVGSATKRFDLSLRGGPFMIDYSRNGRFLTYCGKSGKFAAFDWLTKSLLFESNITEECRDVKFLHQETFIAVAEKNTTCVYDNQGIEVHCIKKLNRILSLEFLPYHFILVASSENGFLYYLDCSTGSVVSSIPTYMGRLGVMCQNRSNAVILTGHNTGVVSMWVPTEKAPVVKMLTHYVGLTSLAVDRSGSYLATCALDRKLKIWDLRSTYEPLSEVSLPVAVAFMDYSQRGLLALGAGSTVQILRDPHLGPDCGELDVNAFGFGQEEAAPGVHRRVTSSAYLTHYAVRPVQCVRFCPYEDVLGVGTAAGVSSILCPGSAEPNYDALEENPFANKRYRQEREVKRLLDKIPHTMISLESIVGKVRREDILEEWEKKKALLLGERPKIDMPVVKRNKQKGRSKAGRFEAKKQNIRFERKMFTIKQALGVGSAKTKRDRTLADKERPSGKPSETLVSRRRLSKKRLKSALDVLIPSKE